MNIFNMIQEAVTKYLQLHELKSSTLKAALIDMDGVLFDSMPNHAASWIKMMAEYHLPFSIEKAYMNEGRTGRATINAVVSQYSGQPLSTEEVDAMYATKCRYFAELPEPKPMEGSMEVLDRLEQCRIKRILVTGSGTKALLGRLDRHFHGIFSTTNMVTGFDVKYGKPHPEPYLMGLKKAQVQVHEAIVIENAPMGVESGHGAGIFTIAVNTGPLPDEVLISRGADLLFHSMMELATNIPTILQSFQQASCKINQAPIP